jgi:hypothetical protein
VTHTHTYIYIYISRLFDDVLGGITVQDLKCRLLKTKPWVKFPVEARDIFFFSTASRPAVGPHPASHPMGTGGSFLGRGVKLTTHLHVVPRAKMAELYLHYPIFFFLHSGGGIKFHSTLRPLNGLLCQPRVIMIMEKSVELLAGQTEVLGENLPQCRFVHHKPHMLPVSEPGPPRWETSV